MSSVTQQPMKMLESRHKIIKKISTCEKNIIKVLHTKEISSGRMKKNLKVCNPKF
jgi:hypothetical protein